MTSKDNKPVSNRRAADGTARGKDLEERLTSLKSKLESAEGQRKVENPDRDSPENQHTRAGVAQAFRLSSEFIAGVVAGAGIGYLVDTFFGTSPWGLIVFLMLGFAAAVLNVMRAAGMVAESEMRLKPAHELHKRQHEGETDRTAEK